MRAAAWAAASPSSFRPSGRTGGRLRAETWVVAVAGLTPIPYKLCTLTAGAFHVNFYVFFIMSFLSRGVRFFVVAGLIYLFGHKIRYFLEKRLDLIFVLCMVLVVIGFILVNYLE